MLTHCIAEVVLGILVQQSYEIEKLERYIVTELLNLIFSKFQKYKVLHKIYYSISNIALFLY